MLKIACGAFSKDEGNVVGQHGLTLMKVGGKNIVPRILRLVVIRVSRVAAMASMFAFLLSTRELMFSTWERSQ